MLKIYSSCIATGETVKKKLRAAHIVPLDKSELYERKDYYSEKNGVILRYDLEDDYDRHMWIFDCDGNVTPLFNFWSHKETILKVEIKCDADSGPSKELILLHNHLAEDAAKHHCPSCWKFVGEVNLKNHELGSCEAINNPGDDDF